MLPSKGIPVEVLYSGINYKDSLAVTGEGKIIRGSFPFIPGIDLVGRVLEEADPYAAGDKVVLTGGGLGERFWGAYTQYQRISTDYLLKLPDAISPLSSMVIGTAGLTAMYSVMQLEDHGITPGRGAVVVTGASGGVGSFSVALLSRLGYHVVASSGKRDRWGYLRALGAAETVGRLKPGRPLESARFSGAVDAVGGDSLAAVLSMVERHGCVAASGNAAGIQLNTTVFPFILRGVRLIGIDSNTSPREKRQRAWKRLADLLDQLMIETIHTRTVSLEGVEMVCDKMISSKIHGRIIIDLRL